MSSKLKKKEKQTQSGAASLKEFTGTLLNYLICIYMLLILVIMPFWVPEDGYLSIGSTKYTFFSRVSLCMGAIALPILLVFVLTAVLEWRQRQGKQQQGKRQQTKKFSLTDCFACLYGIAVILSYLVSDYRENAFWGADSWYMGLVTQLIYIAVYFLISRLWHKKSWMILAVLPVSAVVFLLGYVNRFSVYPLDMKVENVQFISTIGNINWYCGYLVTILFGGIALFWLGVGQKRWQRILLGLYVSVGFATLVTQGSSSGILTLAVMLVVLFCLSAADSGRMLRFWQLVMILAAVCLFTYGIRRLVPEQFNYLETSTELLTNSILPFIMTAVSGMILMLILFWTKKGNYPMGLSKVLGKAAAIVSVATLVGLIGLIAFNTANPGILGRLSESSLFTFTPEWGSMRGATWSAGLGIFAQQNFLHKLIGVGPDCMSAFLYKEGSQELVSMVTRCFGTNALTNAHNEWLTVLVNMGLIGFIGYAGMMSTAIARFLKSNQANGIVIACGFSILAYTINNMFSFQQAMSTITVFVLMGAGEAFARKAQASSSLEITSKMSIKS